MKHRLPLVVAVMALLAVAIPASTAAAKTTISMSGSTSVAPLAAKLAKGYVKAHPRRRRSGSLRAARTSASPTCAPAA